MTDRFQGDGCEWEGGGRAPCRYGSLRRRVRRGRMLAGLQRCNCRRGPGVVRRVCDGRLCMLPEQEGPNYRQLPTGFPSRCPPRRDIQRSDRAVGTVPATTTGSIRPTPLPIPRGGVCNAGRRPSDQAPGCTARRRHLDGALRDRGQCAARRPRLERARAAAPRVVARRDAGGRGLIYILFKNPNHPFHSALTVVMSRKTTTANKPTPRRQSG